MDIDINVTIGPWPTDDHEEWTPESVLAHLHRFGLNAALVRHSVAIRYDPAVGNRMLRAALSGHEVAPAQLPGDGSAAGRGAGPVPDAMAGKDQVLRWGASAEGRLLPAYVLGPLDSGEHGPAEALADRLAAEGVRGIWLYPQAHNWSLAGPEAVTLIAVLRRAKLPVLLDLDETSWSDVDGLAEAAPDLDIVVCGVGYRTLRQMVSVLDRRPRVHVDLSYLASQDGLELLTARYGPSRVLLGTGAPVRDDSAPIYLLGCDGNPSPEVSGGNAQRLLRLTTVAGEAEPSSAVGYGSAADSGPASANARGGAGSGRAGGGISVGGLGSAPSPGRSGLIEVLDAHAHIGAWPNTWMPQQSLAELVAAMDRAGTAQTVISHLQGIWADPLTGNAEAIAAASAYPQRVFVYLVADPQRPQDESILDEQLRLPEVVGIKVHPHTHECPLDDRRYEWIWRMALRHNVPVLGHGFAGTSHSDPFLFGNVAARHPELALLVGHSGATVEGFRRTIEVCQTHPNVYAETCGSWMTGRWLRRLVDEIGADHVVYGTDACVIDQRYGKGRVLGAPLTGAERAQILAGNARRLLKIPSTTGGD